MADWPKRACKGKNTEWWFADRGTQYRQAKEICNGCPVRNACLHEALAVPHSEDYGILGGLDREEREKLRKRGSRVGMSA